MLDALARMADNPVYATIVLVVGVALLLAGGQWLVDGSVSIARRAGWSTLLIGLTLVAFGTSAPELSFNVIAAMGGNTDLSFGNVVGSNFANLGLIIGISALMRPLAVHGRIVRKELPVLAVVSIAVVGVAMVPMASGGPAGFGRGAGLAMLAAFAVFLLAWYRLGKRDGRDPLIQEFEAEAAAPHTMPLAVVLVILGLAALVAGGKLAEVGAIGIARAAGLSQSLIGLTIVAVATSLPELATSVIACRKGHDDLAIGNVVGSNLFNILLVLGTTCTIAPVAVPLPWGWWDLGVMAGLTVLVLPMGFDHRISRAEGALLLVIYAGYMAWSVAREGWG